MRHCARGCSDASPADRGGMASLGPALARLNAGRACPALPHATPKSGCRLNTDHGALGSAVQEGAPWGVVSGGTGLWDRLVVEAMRLPFAPCTGMVTCFTVRYLCSKVTTNAISLARSCSLEIEGCTLNKAIAPSGLGNYAERLLPAPSCWRGQPAKKGSSSRGPCDRAETWSFSRVSTRSAGQFHERPNSSGACFDEPSQTRHAH